MTQEGNERKENQFNMTVGEVEHVIKSKKNLKHLLRMSGYYLPSDKMCTMIFLKKVLMGQKWLLKISKLAALPKLPRIREIST